MGVGNPGRGVPGDAAQCRALVRPAAGGGDGRGDGEATAGAGGAGRIRRTTSTVLALARTYVNLSGEAAEYLLTRYRAEPGRLIVVTDDINLPVGAVRIRKQGSAGGHKGLRSVIDTIGTDKFIRVRIGIGKPASPDRQIEHVLGVPGADERAVLDLSVERAAKAVRTVIGEGVEVSMNRFNSMAPVGVE